MTRADLHPYFKLVHMAFWPVLWWNLVALQRDCERARAAHGEDILISVKVAWWGGVRISRILKPDAPKPAWQQLLLAATARAHALWDDAAALQIYLLNWIVMPRRKRASSTLRPAPPFYNTS